MKNDLEDKLSKYKFRMELLRKGIGVVVLIIQLIILNHLLSQ